MNKLDVDMLKILTNHEVVTIDQLSNFLSTSSVNVRKSIAKLKEFLEEKKLGVISNDKTAHSLELNEKIFKSDFTLTNEDMSNEERYYIILWKLVFEGQVNLSQIAEKFSLNRTSLNLDLKKIKAFLKLNNLETESLPWKGIQIKGAPINRHYFACKLIFKFLIEREYNDLCWEMYGSYVNPKIKQTIDSFVEKTENAPTDIKHLNYRIIEEINSVAGIETFNFVKAILIYIYLFEENIGEDDCSDKYIVSLPEVLQKRYYQLLGIFSQIDEIKNTAQYSKNLNLLTFLILHIDEEYFKFIDDQKVIDMKEYIENRYAIEISESDVTLLHILYKRSLQKYNFNILSYNNYFLGDNTLPERIIRDLDEMFERFNIHVLQEDYQVFVLYVYQLICEKYEKGNYHDKILIIDSTTNNWIANGFKNEVLKYIPSVTIDVKSIYKLSGINPDEYDYILFTNFVDKKRITRFFPGLKKNLIQLKYTTYFEINNFLEYLYFEHR